MERAARNRARGFTLIELLVAMALGLLVVGAMASLFKTGLNAMMLVTQRTETQQNMRAAMDLMVKDISMAGAGLPSGGIQLPNGGGSSASKFACDQGGTCHVPAFNYPNNNYMYGIIPGFNNGVENNAVIAAAPPPVLNDSITVVYADYNFPLWEYDITFPTPGNGGLINLAPNPTFVPAPPLVTAAGGIQVGDLIMLSNSLGTAVGEVTNLTPGNDYLCRCRCTEYQSERRGAEQHQDDLRRREYGGVPTVCRHVLPDRSRHGRESAFDAAGERVESSSGGGQHHQPAICLRHVQLRRAAALWMRIRRIRSGRGNRSI